VGDAHFFDGAPLYARAPKGERAYGSVPRNRGKKNTTLVASLSLGGIGAAMTCAAMTFEGATTKVVFETYVEEVLAPMLEPEQIS
jgi:hypothetical protein